MVWNPKIYIAQIFFIKPQKKWTYFRRT